MKKKEIFDSIKILAAGGIILALYLLWQQLFRPAWQPCSLNQFVNCDAIVKGEVAKTLGVPTPLIGLVGYIIILLSAVFKKKTLIFSMATFGLFFCLWIGYREIFELHVICPVCIGCELIMITVFYLSYKALKTSH